MAVPIYVFGGGHRIHFRTHKIDHFQVYDRNIRVDIPVKLNVYGIRFHVPSVYISTVSVYRHSPTQVESCACVHGPIVHAWRLESYSTMAARLYRTAYKVPSDNQGGGSKL
jgi:hypothetical protein